MELHRGSNLAANRNNTLFHN